MGTYISKAFTEAFLETGFKMSKIAMFCRRFTERGQGVSFKIFNN
jgi:hypothetical protein